MKIILPAVLMLFVATSLFAGAPDPVPTVNVMVKDQNKELAAGFAAAFTGIKNVPAHAVLDRDGKTTTVPDIRRVTAVGAVLVLENGKGQSYVVSPRDVVWFSDTPVEKPAVVK